MTTTTTPATPAFATMGRKEFSGFLYALYRCGERGVNNDAEAEATFDDVSHVELLLTPEGPVIAVHHGPAPHDVVTVIRADLAGLDMPGSYKATN